jgi:hypothetical protein
LGRISHRTCTVRGVRRGRALGDNAHALDDARGFCVGLRFVRKNHARHVSSVPSGLSRLVLPPLSCSGCPCDSSTWRSTLRFHTTPNWFPSLITIPNWFPSLITIPNWFPSLRDLCQNASEQFLCFKKCSVFQDFFCVSRIFLCFKISPQLQELLQLHTSSM